MKRTRRKRKNNTIKLGSLFIIIIFSLSGISVSYAHWEEILDIFADMETTEWDVKDCNIKVAYEDLRINNGNDWDYNDFVINISTTGSYIKDELTELIFNFEALARGAAYKHDLYMKIPAGTFGTDGAYTITYYNTDGSYNSSIIGNFDDISDLILTIFPNTWDALPPTAGHSFCANVIDCTGRYPGRKTIVTINFSGYFSVNNINLGDYTLDFIGTNGLNLFFNPYLSVRNTGENINIGDPRFIAVPQNWIWPQETVRIWNVYPYNSTRNRGVQSGSPPTFVGEWYLESPTTYKWDPYCP